MARSHLGLVAVAGFATAVQATPAVRPDTAGLGALVRQLVVDSLMGGGTRADAVLVAADSASAALLGLAGLPAAAPEPAGLVCPGSTGPDGRPAPAPVGYVVRLALAAGADAAVRQIRVSTSCGFRYLGRGRGFREAGTWELRLRGGRWRLAGVRERSVT